VATPGDEENTMGNPKPTIVVRAHEGTVTATATSATFRPSESGEGGSRRFASLRAALLAHPELLDGCTVEGLSPDDLARRCGGWEVPASDVEIDGEYYERRDGIFCPYEAAWHAEYEEVASRSFTRYGGDIGPCSSDSYCEIGRVRNFWLVRWAEEGWVPVGWFDRPEEGLAATAEASGVFAVDRDGALLPSIGSEDDAAWWEGRIVVLTADGPRALEPTPADEAVDDADSYLPSLLRWSHRAQR
jgi:hypothetical protein